MSPQVLSKHFVLSVNFWGNPCHRDEPNPVIPFPLTGGLLARYSSFAFFFSSFVISASFFRFANSSSFLGWIGNSGSSSKVSPFFYRFSLSSLISRSRIDSVVLLTTASGQSAMNGSITFSHFVTGEPFILFFFFFQNLTLASNDLDCHLVMFWIRRANSHSPWFLNIFVNQAPPFATPLCYLSRCSSVFVTPI